VNIILFDCPKTGKTTLFNILTGTKVPVQSYGEVKSGRRDGNVIHFRFAQ
jgi:Fe2+ transport system protein B